MTHVLSVQLTSFWSRYWFSVDFVASRFHADFAWNFDLPSSLFGQFKDEKVTQIARELDQKLAHLIDKSQSLDGF